MLVADREAQLPVALEMQVGDIGAETPLDRVLRLVQQVLHPQVLADPQPGLPRTRAQPARLCLLCTQPVALVGEGVQGLGDLRVSVGPVRGHGRHGPRR